MTVKVIIKDYDGVPFDQAHVYFKNDPSKGAYTNFDGLAIIPNVNVGDVLVFSHVESGQKMEKAIGENDIFLQISMMRNILLDQLELNGKRDKNYSWLWLIVAGVIIYKVNKARPKKVIL